MDEYTFIPLWRWELRLFGPPYFQSNTLSTRPSRPREPNKYSLFKPVTSTVHQNILDTHEAIALCLEFFTKPLCHWLPTCYHMPGLLTLFVKKPLKLTLN